MITIEQMVSREVYYCVSSLVSTLAQGAGDRSHSLDLSNLLEQAIELSAPVLDYLDYEEAAREAGFDGADKLDGAPVKSDGHVDWRELCEQNDIDPYEWEVYEHWIVSDWLADKLEAHGEKVDKDFAGLTVWARTTTGQAIAMDSVIENIYAELTAAK